PTNFSKSLKVWEQRVPILNSESGIHFRLHANKVSIFKAFKPDLKMLTFIIPVAKSSRKST
ncbi:MAG: hypothetical protein PHY44_02445, partial [Lachnospiraceae bacterium]|nr:hypothetical protein [Lachnospiraceae bacterium]